MEATGELRALIETNVALKAQAQTSGRAQNEATNVNENTMTHVLRVYPLRQWIKHSLLSFHDTGGKSAVSSPLYLKAALKIAKRLADLLSQGENPPSASDWAGCVMVRVKDNSLNCGADQELNYLSFESVEIQSSNNDFSNTGGENSRKGEAERIFQLALVFYELFSGGAVPPPELNDLASSDGAFVSLPSLSLSNTPDSDQSSPVDTKRHRGLSSFGRNVGVCDVVFDRLKILGVTSPLCLLVFNMLDGVYGDLSGNECYTKLSDISLDLQLMMDKPSKFVQDLDAAKLSLSGLQLDETVIPRDEQLETLQSCYNSCVSGSSEVVIIRGESGSGKSWLAKKAGTSIVKAQGVFLTGKFDQMKQPKPFSALASAFDQYCDLILSGESRNVAEQLRATLGKNIRILYHLIPKLRQVLDDVNATTENDLDECRNPTQRLNKLLCQLVEVISANSGGHITLFMDDIQWADGSSISIIQRLLKQEHKRIFFIFCFRGEEMEIEHPFWKMIKEVCAGGINKTEVPLTCMEGDTLNKVVSDLLCLPKRLTRSLSDIVYNRSKGNPLFFLQTMHLLNRDGLLYIDLDKKRWLWDVEKISQSKLPDNIALCFTTGINNLAPDVQTALHTLSTFGGSAKSDYIMFIETDLNINLINPLKVAAAEGLVSMNGAISFCHDRIQEASYNIVEEQDRVCNHLAYGKCLMKHMVDTGDDHILFTSVNQINLGGAAAVSDREDYFILAKYNLVAGKKAMGMSDFAAAFSFFDHGMSFLRKDSWKKHYDFTLELYELAAKASLAVGNNECLHLISHQVLNNAKCFDDKLDIYSTIISSLAYASKLAGALERGLDIVTKLDLDIPRDPTQDVFIHHVQRTLDMIRGLSSTDLQNYQPMKDKKRVKIMKLLSQMQLLALLVKPTIYPFIAMNMVQMSISYGVSSMSPIGFSCFASLLGKLGHMQHARQCTFLAKSLLDRFGLNDGAGEVLAGIAEVQAYLEPMQSVVEFHTKGFEVSMSVGDIQWACLCKLQHTVLLFWSGVNLQILEKEASENCQFMQSYDHDTSLLLMLILQRTIWTLSGGETDVLSGHDLFEKVIQNKNPRQSMVLSVHNLYLALMFNQDDVKECLEKFMQLDLSTPCLVSTESVQVFVAGLAAFRIYRETNDSIWLDRGRQHKETIKLWATEGCEWNFKQKLLLLEAEESYSIGNFSSAKQSYKKAISTAKAHKFANDEALACELAARFYLKTDDKESSKEHFRLAHTKYLEWGAVRKAEVLVDDAFEKLGTNFLPYS